MPARDRPEPSQGATPGVAVGSVVGRYKLLGKLGQCSTVAVYAAENMRLGRTVALTLLPRGPMGKEDAVQRFLRAASAATRLDHPNIAAVYDVSCEGDWCYVEMQKVHGRTLQELAASRLPLGVGEAMCIVRSVADALQAAHEKGMVHRQLRPANVWIARDGRAVVSGFGLASALAEVNLGTAQASAQGPYAPPEQAEGKPADLRGDIYALGVTFYYLLTGRHPYATEAKAGQKKAQEAMVPLNTHNPKVPDALCAVIAKMAAKKPEERYQNAAALINDLDKIDGKTGHCLVRLLGADEARVFWLSGVAATIGRDDVNTICLRDQEASGWHATVVPTDGGCRLKDMKSRNGTEVNGERIEQVQLESGDLVCIGASQLVFVDIGSTKTAASRPGAYQLVPSPVQGAPRPRPVRSGATLIGRHRANHLNLDDDAVSEFHAQVFVSGQSAVVTDLKSRTGVRVNGQRVLRHELSVGDVVSIGTAEFRFEMAAAAQARPAARSDAAEAAPRRPPAPSAEAPPRPAPAAAVPLAAVPPEAPPAPPQPAPAGPQPGVPLGSLCIPSLDSSDLHSLLAEEAARLGQERGEPGAPATSGVFQSSPMVTADLRSALAEEAERLGQHAEQPHEPSAADPDAMGLTLECIAGALKGQQWLVGQEPLVLGRDPTVTIEIPVPRVSRRHAELRGDGPKAVLKDLGSRDGTLVDGAKIKTRELGPGDVFEIAGVRFRLQAGRV